MVPAFAFQKITVPSGAATCHSSFDPSGKFLVSSSNNGDLTVHKRVASSYHTWCHWQGVEERPEPAATVTAWYPYASRAPKLFCAQGNTIALWSLQEKAPQHVVSYSSEKPVVVAPPVEDKKSRKTSKGVKASSEHKDSLLRSTSKDDKKKVSHSHDKKRSKSGNKDGEPTEEKSEDILKLPIFISAASKIQPKQVTTFHQAPKSRDIHSLSPSLDGEVILSGSDLALNFWNLQHPEIPLSVLDFTCSSHYVGDLKESITCASFHPTQTPLYVWGSTCGNINLCDTRLGIRATSKSFVETNSERSYVSIITSCVSDAKFCTNDQNLMVSRNYLNILLWDIRKEDRPILKNEVHKNLRPQFAELFDRGFIFDQFKCAINPSGSKIVTGTYGRTAILIDVATNKSTLLCPTPFEPQEMNDYFACFEPPLDLEYDKFSQRIDHCSWNPDGSCIVFSESSKRAFYVYDLPKS
eukprot:TRINITY_DN5424_c0_g1_i1.p1 TRINITY_DN5424_c0_g1~~TRINITY_DN5424_c0_g1_i1.p1  ORF type:complete len:468 (+),score=70.46 TRINITY_DN5424_c0_g1_i1:65-1468(+)